MIWDFKDQGWNEALKELQTYYQEHGNLDIKARYETADGFKLGRWICNLRTKVKTKGLDQSLTKEQQEHMKKGLEKPLKQAVWEFPTDFAMFREQAVTNS